MFKVLIVDDDVLARTSIKSLIQWEKNGFEVSGEATNGMNAIQAITENRPDIVITDMSMPVMDGVELIEYIKMNCLQIKVIALSGYNDFNYVRNSLKGGAIDYVLKHMLDAFMLIKVLNTAVESIIKERHDQDREEQLQKHITIGKSIAKRNFIMRLIHNDVSDRKEIKETAFKLGIDIDMRNLIIIIAEIDDYIFLKEKYSIQELDALLQSFQSIAENTLADGGKYFISHIEKGRFVIIHSFGNTHSYLFVYKGVNESINRVKQSVKRYFNITASFSISDICEDVVNMNKYYSDAEKLMKDKFFKGKDNILRGNVVDFGEKKVADFGIEEEKKLIKLVKCLEKAKVCDYISNMFNEFINCKSNIQSVQIVCSELINIVNRIARELTVDIRKVYSNEDLPYNKLQKYETNADIKNWVLNTYETLIVLLEQDQVKLNYSENIMKVIEFIQKNYNKDISLNDPAAYIGVSSTYLSHAFKAECGKGFIEFLNAFRVEKAKLLIESGNMQIKDIVKEVGFNSYNYFFKVFKNNLGMTPLEYKEQLKNL